MKSLLVCNTLIKENNGRFSLNDLHKASESSSDQNKKPFFWLKNQQTQELVKEVEQVDKYQLNKIQAVSSVHGGINSGTYAVKELVYAYAMWISAKFHLHVIRAYDDLVLSGRTPPKTIHATNLINIQQYDAIIKAMNSKSPEPGDKAMCNHFYRRFNVKNVGSLPEERYEEAMLFLREIPNHSSWDRVAGSGKPIQSNHIADAGKMVHHQLSIPLQPSTEYVSMEIFLAEISSLKSENRSIQAKYELKFEELYREHMRVISGRICDAASSSMPTRRR